MATAEEVGKRLQEMTPQEVAAKFKQAFDGKWSIDELVTRLVAPGGC